MRYPFVSLELFPLKFSVKPGTPRCAATKFVIWIGILAAVVAFFTLVPTDPLSFPTGVPEKPHYRAVMLVLASNNNQIYKNARRVWMSYMDKEPTIKIFFIYGKNAIPKEELTAFDLQYEDIEENYNPGMILKTQRAMQEMQRRYTFDFFIRTNISTFWDLKRLLEHLKLLPLQLCYSGHGPHGGHQYLSGTDTIVNGYMVADFLKHADEGQMSLVAAEDQAMGIIFHGVMGAKFLSSRICFLEDFQTADEISFAVKECMANNMDHFRVKATSNREAVDLMAYKHLLKTIYSINLK